MKVKTRPGEKRWMKQTLPRRGLKHRHERIATLRWFSKIRRNADRVMIASEVGDL